MLYGVNRSQKLTSWKLLRFVVGSPGMSRGRASKKSPAFIRMYSCDVYAHDPSPISLPHASASLSIDEVKDELTVMCNRVAQVSICCCFCCYLSAHCILG